jgi:uncharacterized protein YbjT (DUF2867 family)
MSRTSVRYTTTARSAFLTGPARVIVPAIKAARSPRQWVPELGGWSIPLRHLDDVLAAIQHRNGDDAVERAEAAL